MAGPPDTCAADGGPAPLEAPPSPALGDTGWAFDGDRADPRFPDMGAWAAAGVRGGVPPRRAWPVRATLHPVSGEDAPEADAGPRIQAAIEAAAAAGGGVVRLAAGTYPLGTALALRGGVALRGDGAHATTLDVTLRFRGATPAAKTPALSLVGVSRAGVEDLTMTFRVEWQGVRQVPLDDDWPDDYWSKYELRVQAFQNERVYHDRQRFCFHPATDLYVDFVWVNDAVDCWVDGCALLNAGSNGVIVGADAAHITLRGSTIRGAFQKGPDGNGYGINVSGRSVLATGNTVSHVRHWAIQCGARHCVVVANHIQTDVNFHQRDAGHNLVEGNTQKVPAWHLWRPFQRGAACHGDPGPCNLLHANRVWDRQVGRVLDEPGRVYAMGRAEAEPLEGDAGSCPTGGVLYAVKRC